jgi:hypothetical protein
MVEQENFGPSISSPKTPPLFHIQWQVYIRSQASLMTFHPDDKLGNHRNNIAAASFKAVLAFSII